LTPRRRPGSSSSSIPHSEFRIPHSAFRISLTNSPRPIPVKRKLSRAHPKFGHPLFPNSSLLVPVLQWPKTRPQSHSNSAKLNHPRTRLDDSSSKTKHCRQRFPPSPCADDDRPSPPSSFVIHIRLMPGSVPPSTNSVPPLGRNESVSQIANVNNPWPRKNFRLDVRQLAAAFRPTEYEINIRGTKCHTIRQNLAQFQRCLAVGFCHREGSQEINRDRPVDFGKPRIRGTATP
jgi:hypothetical protein